MFSKPFKSKFSKINLLLFGFIGLYQISYSQLVFPFNYTGGMQSWVVPPGVTNISIESWGAEGGTSFGQSGGMLFLGGKGAYIKGDYTVIPGQTLNILVGQRGANGASCGSGGGGGSFVVRSGVLLEAAGGGGGGFHCNALNGVAGGDGQITTSGGPGISASPLIRFVFAGGVGGNGGNSYYGGGGGGWLTGGTCGSIGASGAGSAYPGTGGTIGGGYGGGGGYYTWCCGGSGGGGGYSGGSGGTSDGCAGGGGGSYNTGINQVNTPGIQLGNGKVVITILYSVQITQTASITCNGGLTAALSASVSGGSTPYSYTWTPGGINTQTIGGLGAGVYTVTVKDNLGSFTSSSYTVTQPSPVTGTITSTNANCSSSLGSATVVAGGGTPGYTYSWTPSGGSSAIASGLPVGNYTCTIKDLNNCVGISTVAISFLNPTPTITVNSGTICPGQSFTMTPGGAVSYTYAGGSAVVSPGATTTYTVVGSSALGCLSSVVTSTVTVGSNLLITVNSGTVCPGNSFTITPGGASTYTYAGGSAIVSPTTTTTYTVQGSDALGCLSTIETSTVTVGAFVPITVNSGSICSGTSFTMNPVGVVSYTYSGGSAVVNPMTTTIYSVQGTDALGCLSTIETSTVTVISSPTITVNSGVICNGNSFTLTPAGAASFTIAGGSSIVNPTSTTTYTVVGANGGVCISAPVTSTVTVNPNPTITVNSATICEGKSYTISPTGASSYTYSSSSNIVSPLVTTNYSITGVNSFGCSSTATIVVTVNPLPILTLAGNTVICSGVSTDLVLSGASSYTWTPGKYLNTVNGPSVTATPSVSTTHTVFASSALGCVTDFAVPISVIETPTLSIAATPTIICEGQSSSLAAFGASTYSWSPSTFISSVSANPTIVNPTVTTTYTLQGFNSAPPHYCVSTKTVQVLVIPKIIASINPVQPLCIGQSTTFKASGGNTYSWTPIDGLSKPTSSITIVQRTVSTSYTVTVSKNGACATQATIDLVVVPVPIVDAGKDTSVQVGESITLIGKGNVTVGFRNMDGTSLDCNYCSSVKVSPQNNTCYELRGENSFGCVSIDEVCVNVIKDWNVYIPNAFSPDDDGINEYFVPVGYGIAKMSLTIYDRWGTKIFYEESVEKGWDGKYLGKLSKQDVYVYVVEIKTMEGTITKKTGHLTLISKVK